MHAGAIQRSYNLPHYYAQRACKIKIKKRDLYYMLDNPERLKEKLIEKEIADNHRISGHEAYFLKQWGIK